MKASLWEHLPWLPIGERTIKSLVALISRIRSSGKITTNVTPKDIYTSAEGVSLLQKKNVYQQYLGERVNWRVNLEKVIPDPVHQHLANLEFVFIASPITTYTVRCSVRFSKHLELLTFHRPLTVQLYGRIEAIAEDGITLTKPELVFLSKA